MDRRRIDIEEERNITNDHRSKKEKNKRKVLKWLKKKQSNNLKKS